MRLPKPASAVVALVLALPAARTYAATPRDLLDPPGQPVDARGASQAQGAAEPVCLLSDPTLDRRGVAPAACITCHATGTGNFGHGGHTCDVPYTTYGKDLRPDPERFNAAVVLAGNRITCLTCHDPRSRLVQHLAAPTAGEVAKRLCVACHPH